MCFLIKNDRIEAAYHASKNRDWASRNPRVKGKRKEDDHKPEQSNR